MGIRISFTPIRANTTILYPAKSISEAKFATDKYAAEVIAKLKVYPPRMPNQRYLRTNKLKMGWRARPRAGSGSYSIQIVNGASDRGKFYANWVQSRPTQQAIFHGRWLTWQDIVDRQEYRRRIQKAIDTGIALSR